MKNDAHPLPEARSDDSGLRAPAVSVIVPCRDEAAYIESCLASVLNQETVPGGFEVIVVDGGSRDGTRALLDRLAAHDARLRVLDNPRLITAAGMNLGIRAARAERILILGAHSFYAPDYIKSCVALLDEHPEADCVGGPIEHAGRTPFGRAVAAAMSHPLGVGNALHRYAGYEGFAEGACFPMFRRDVFARIGPYDESLVRNQDDELNLRLAESGGRVYLSPRAHSVYHVRETARALARQYFAYGFWRVAVMRRRRYAVGWRRYVPPATLVLAVALVALGPAFPWPWTLVAGVLPALYLLLLLAGTAQAARRIGPAAAVRFPLAAAIMHAAYALGFLWALVAGRTGGAAETGGAPGRG